MVIIIRSPAKTRTRTVSVTDSQGTRTKTVKEGETADFRASSAKRSGTTTNSQNTSGNAIVQENVQASPSSQPITPTAEPTKQPAPQSLTFTQLVAANTAQPTQTRDGLTFNQLVAANARTPPEPKKGINARVSEKITRGRTFEQTEKDMEARGIVTERQIIEQAKKDESLAFSRLPNASPAEARLLAFRIQQSRATVAAQSFQRGIRRQLIEEPVTSAAVVGTSFVGGGVFQLSKQGLALAGLKAGTKIGAIGKGTVIAAGVLGGGAAAFQIGTTEGGLQGKSEQAGRIFAVGAPSIAAFSAGRATAKSGVTLISKNIAKQRAIESIQVQKSVLGIRDTPRGTENAFAVRTSAIVNDKKLNLISQGATRDQYGRTRGLIITSYGYDNQRTTSTLLSRVDAEKIRSSGNFIYQRDLYGRNIQQGFISSKDLLGKETGQVNFLTRTDFKQGTGDVRTVAGSVFAPQRPTVIGSRITPRTQTGATRVFDIRSKGVTLARPPSAVMDSKAAQTIARVGTISNKKGQISISGLRGGSTQSTLSTPSAASNTAALLAQKEIVTGLTGTSFAIATAGSSAALSTGIGAGTGVLSQLRSKQPAATDLANKNLLRIAEQPDQKFAFKITPETTTVPAQDSALRITPITTSDFLFSISSTPPPTPTVPLPPVGGGFIAAPLPVFLPDLGGTTGTRQISPRGATKQKKKFSPTLAAVALNIRAPSTRQGIRTGLGIRGIPR